MTSRHEQVWAQVFSRTIGFWSFFLKLCFYRSFKKDEIVRAQWTNALGVTEWLPASIVSVPAMFGTKYMVCWMRPSKSGYEIVLLCFFESGSMATGEAPTIIKGNAPMWGPLGRKARGGVERPQEITKIIAVAITGPSAGSTAITGPPKYVQKKYPKPGSQLPGAIVDYRAGGQNQ